MTVRGWAVVAGTLVGAIAVVTAGGAAARSATSGGASAESGEQAVPVLVLGTYHMGNPGRDIHNATIAPVTTPAKQAELAALARRLAAFRPTVVAIEGRSDAPDLADPGYVRFRPADLTTQSDETVQIGYRVAALTHARVVAIDVQERPGEPSYFPFEPVADWAKTHAAVAPGFAALNAAIERSVKTLERDQSRLSVTQILAGMNGRGSGDKVQEHREFYYGLERYGDRDAQPGAELNGRWYTRNAKIFAKLAQVTRPGDRVLVVYGAGHAYWLRHFASETPGYRLVEATPYLRGR